MPTKYYIAADGNDHLPLVDVVKLPEVVALTAENKVRGVFKI